MSQVKVRFQESTAGLQRFLKKASKRYKKPPQPQPQDQDPELDLVQAREQVFHVNQEQPVHQSGYVDYLVNDIQRLLPQFEVALDHYHQSAQAYRKASAQRRKLGNLLKSNVRDFWQVLKRRTRRLEHPTYILGQFQIPQQKTSPAEINDSEDIKALAQTFIKGDANLVAQDYPPMSNPSAADLQTLLDQLKERQDVDEADITYQKAQARFNKCTKEAILLQRLLNHTLQAVYAHLQPGQLRRLMGHYGFTFLGGPLDETGNQAREEPEAEAPDTEAGETEVVVEEEAPPLSDLIAQETSAAFR